MSAPKPKLSWFLIFLVAGFLAAMLASGGCEGMKTPSWMQSSPKAAAKVTRVDMFCPPVVSDFDADGQSDGVPARMMFYAVDDGTYRAVRPAGEVTFKLYSGRFIGSVPASVKPLQIWTVTTTQLANYEGSQFKMVCYQLPLRWKKPPPRGRITFTATLKPENTSHPTVTSQPVVLPFDK